MSWRFNADNMDNYELENLNRPKSSNTNAQKLSILKRFPGRVPVIVEKLDQLTGGRKHQKAKQQQQAQRKSRTAPDDDSTQLISCNKADFKNSLKLNHQHCANQQPTQERFKFLVPYDCTIGQFQSILRKKIQIPASKAIFLIIDRTLPHASCLIGELYRDYHSADGFLYVRYSGENTFGSNWRQLVRLKTIEEEQIERE